MALKETKHNHKNGNFISYEDSKKWVEENELTKNVKTIAEWRFITYKLPYFIPKDPKQYYYKKGTWKGWGDFLGTENKKISCFIKYEEAKKWVRENLPNIKSQSQWRSITYKLPPFIPKSPYRFYKGTGEWNSWMCFLEFEYKKTINNPLHKSWTEQEKKIVIDSWCNMPTEDVVKLLSNRTVASIDIFAVRKLKLHKDKEYVKKVKSENTSGKKNPMYGKQGANLGKPMKQETKDKLSKSKTGSVGLSGEKNPMYGKPSVNRGKKLPRERVDKMIKTRKENYDKLSEEEKHKVQLRRAKQIVERTKNMRKNPTLPERIVSKILSDLNIIFETQKRIDYYLCDCVIGKKIIEIQGDYWHGNPIRYNESNINETQKKNIHRDKTKKSFLINKGYKILYLWEYDLIKNYSMCEKLVNEFLEINI